MRSRVKLTDANGGSDDRREFLRQMAAFAAAVPLAVGAPDRLSPRGDPSAPGIAHTKNAAPAAAPFTGYQFFGPEEATFVEALVNVMCPPDQYTPNGVDCGLANYFDRQLAGPFGQGQGRYMRGPWLEGKPQLGYQLPLTPAEFFRAGLSAAGDACVKRYGKSFDQLSPGDANAFLADLQAGRQQDSRVSLAMWFNEFVYPLFAQACFADPMYGGNYNKVFWKLVGYPGLPATHALDMVEYRGKPYPGAQDPKSIADFA
jgi:gluconate 2-dehydrogenase gamma chain